MNSELQGPGADFLASRVFEWIGGPYRALGHTFQVRTESAADFQPRLANSLEPLLDPSVAHPSHTYDVIDQGQPISGRYVVYDNGSKVGASASRYVTAGRIHWLTNQGAILTAAPSVVQLHAGGVQRSGLTVVLPAPMDAGKSTTVAGLLRAGYSYLSDEVVEVGPLRAITTTFPKALALDRSSVQLLGSLDAPFEGATAEPQWHVTAGGLSAGPAPHIPCHADLFIFPQYREGADTHIQSLTPGEATVALCESTFKFRERAAVALPLLTELAELVPARRLIIGDLTRAVALATEELGKIAHHTHQGGHQHAS